MGALGVLFAVDFLDAFPDLATVAANGGLELTEAGLEVAQRTYERHTVLSELFIALGVDSKTAEADACKIEHVISDATFDALKRHLREKRNDN